MSLKVPIEWFDACAAGIYLLFGVIHLDLWLRRRERASHLWLASTAGGALLVDLTGMYLRRAGWPPRGVVPALNELAVLVATASIFELVRSLTGERPTRLAQSIYALLAGVSIVIGYEGVRGLEPYYLFACALLLLTAMARAVQRGRAGNRESREIAGGLVILVLCLVADILMMTNIIAQVPALPMLGFSALFVVSARALNGRYAREHHELAELRNELEQRVLDRTRELEDANRRLDEVSRTDTLTGLPNRRAFLDAGERAAAKAARAGETCTVAMIDLDHFKRINDLHGHAAGDAMLKAAASSLRTILREEDLVARWGGEEFIVLLPQTSEEQAVLVAEHARKALATTAFRRNGATESITGSFGIAAHREDRTFEATIAAADEALYRAKRNGRNCIVVAS